MTVEGGVLEQEIGSLFEQILRVPAFFWKRVGAQSFPNHAGRLIDGHRPIGQCAKKFCDALDQLAPHLAKLTGGHFERCDSIRSEERRVGKEGTSRWSQD